MRPNLTLARIALERARAERPARQPPETDVFPGLERLGRQRRKRMLAARVAARANARHTGALVALAALEGSRGRADEVERLCRCALALAPGMRPARRNLAIALLEMGRHEEAERLLDAMLAADYADAEAHWYRGLARLSRGALGPGWAELDWRWRRPGTPAPFVPPAPEWNSKLPLRGRRLWLWAEPALCDQVVFLSMLPDVLARQPELAVECDPRLTPLLRRSFPAVRFVSQATDGEAAAGEACDYQLSLGSLAAYMRPDIGAFPKRTAYFVPDPGEQLRWRNWLNGLGGGLKVGIACRSDEPRTELRAPYARARQWLPVLRHTRAQFVLLQGEAAASELDEIAARAGLSLHHPPGLNRSEDVDGLCALASTLDLVISVPAAASVIAGAVGVPTWQLNCGIDWQGLNQPYSPWQPSVRRFYKPWDRSWDEELACVAMELARLTAA